MPFRNNDMTMPPVNGNRATGVRRRTNRTDDGEIDFAGFQQAQRFGFAGRQQVYSDVREFTGHGRNAHRQHVLRLRMRRGDAQFTAGRIAQVCGQRANVRRLRNDGACTFDHLCTGRRHGVQALALAPENLETQFTFKLPELLGDAGLCRINAFGSLRDAQAGIDDRDKVTKLYQVHGGGHSNQES